MPHKSSSIEHELAEVPCLEAAQPLLGVTFQEAPPVLSALRLDGFADGDVPTCVEVFAHIGPSKSGQQRKLSRDMTKLLLAEKLLGTLCRKVLVVADEAAIAYFQRAWDGDFARRFGIETLVVDVEPQLRATLMAAQERQRR